MSSNVYIGSTPVIQSYLGSTFAQVSPRFDDDAEAFFEATGITNVSLKGSITNFVQELKGDGLWDKMIQILPFVSDNTASLETQFKYNLKDVNNYSASFPNGLGTSDLDGFQASISSTIYVDTNFVEDSETNSKRNTHISIYTNSTADVGSTIDYGSFTGGGPTQNYTYVTVGRNNGSGDSDKIFGYGGTIMVDVDNTPIATGSFVANYTGSQYDFRENTNSIGSGVKATAQRYANISSFLGGWNNNTSPANLTDKKYQCFTRGFGLTSSEIDTLSTRIQTLQESIDSAIGTSRAV